MQSNLQSNFRLLAKAGTYILLLCYSISLFGQSDLAPLKVTTNVGPEPGFLLLAPNSRVTPRPYAPYLGAYNVSGGVVRVGGTANYPFEFKVFPDGRLGYSELVVFAGASVPAGVYIVDTLFAQQEFISQKRGYLATQHDFQMLPNGHRVMLGAEDVTVDMSVVVPGGHPAANVVGAIVQEIDGDGNVVAQWRSLDHLPITDSYENIQAAAIRYAHNNSLWIDDDGNWLISMRHMSQVIKVNRSTGDVMWILGGKSNQFVFGGDREENAPTFFSYQHDARRLPNGHISLFDNGTQHTPKVSRGVEYEIDEANKTCRMVWDYRHIPDYYASIQGGMQTLANGHRLLGWGSAATDGSAAVTEVDSTGAVVFEASYPKQMYVYRATKYPVWPTGRPSASVQIKDVLNSDTYSYHRGMQNVGLTATFTSLDSYFYNSTVARRFVWSPKNPLWQTEAPQLHQSRVTLQLDGIRSATMILRFNADTLGITVNPERYTVYQRSVVDSGRFSPLSTRFDAVSRELVAEGATGGEYAFGIAPPDPNTPRVPVLNWPIAGVRVLENATHALRVSLRGRVDSLRVQVARDATMSDLALDTTTQSDRVTFSAGTSTKVMYWRARSIAGSQNSAWSGTDSFTIAPAYISVVRPETDVVWTQDSNYVVSWKTNVPGSVRIELMKGSQVAAVVRDSVVASSQGYLWLVPVTVALGKEYHVRIVSREPQFAEVADEGIQNIEITGISSVNDYAVDAPSPVSVYPQPALDNVHVENIGSGITSIAMYSTSGELALSRIMRGTKAQLDVRLLSAGMYTVVTEDYLGRTFRSALLINR